MLYNRSGWIFAYSGSIIDRMARSLLHDPGKRKLTNSSEKIHRDCGFTGPGCP